MRVGHSDTEALKSKIFGSRKPVVGCVGAAVRLRRSRGAFHWWLVPMLLCLSPDRKTQYVR